MLCPNCNTEINKEETYCKNCGEKLKTTKKETYIQDNTKEFEKELKRLCGGFTNSKIFKQKLKENNKSSLTHGNKIYKKKLKREFQYGYLKIENLEERLDELLKFPSKIIIDPLWDNTDTSKIKTITDYKKLKTPPKPLKSLKFEDTSFRKICNTLIVISDEKFANEHVKKLYIDTILDNNNLKGEQITEALDKFKLPNKINSLLLVPFIDYNMGIRFSIFGGGILKNSTPHLTDTNPEVSIILDKDMVKNYEFFDIKDLTLESDESLEELEYSAKTLRDAYLPNPEIQKIREIKILDQFRHNDFPDDVLVIFKTENLYPEGIWVRCEKILLDKVFGGEVLNQPNQDFQVNIHDKIKFEILSDGNQEVCFAIL